MFCFELWVLVLLLARIARADYYIDNANTSVAFSYAPNTNGAGWKSFGTGIQALAFSIPNGTTTVNVTVDATQCYDQTFALGVCGTTENCRVWIPFVGSGISAYVVNVGTVGVSASFSIDNGQGVTNTLPSPPAPSYQQYNVSMFTKQNLPTGYHELAVTILEWNGQQSYMMFDYALVNETFVANTTTSPNATSSQTPTSSSTPSSGPSNSVNVGAVVGGTLAGVAGVAAIVLGILYMRKRKEEVTRKEDTAQVTPFISGHSTNGAFQGAGRRFEEDRSSPSPSIRAAILRDALASSSSPSTLTSNTRPLPTVPSAGFNNNYLSAMDGLTAEDIKTLERLRWNNVPPETIARVAESLRSTRATGPSSDTSGASARLMRAGSLMSAAPPPSYQTGG